MGYMTIKEKKPQTFKEIKAKLMKLFSPKDILPLFLFPRAKHALSCMQPSSVWWGRYSSSVALLKLRVFLLCLPKWMCQLTQPITWRWLCVSQAQVSELSAEQWFCCQSQSFPSGELQSDGVGADFQQQLSQRATASHSPCDTANMRAALPSFLPLDQKPRHCHYF